jgi:hypothetical protein
MHHIRDTLPDLKSKVMKLLAEEVSKLVALGDADGESINMLGGTLLKIISKFAINVNTSIDGRGHLSSSLSACDGAGYATIEMSELYGGARISYIFNEIFGKLLWSMDPFEGLDDDEIRTAIANANGTRPSLFVPEISFDLLVKKQISRLEAPGSQCVDMILDEMLRFAYQCELPEMLRFPLLRDRIYEIVTEMLKSCVKPTQQMIVNMIHVELAYINTSHPDFIGGKQALQKTIRTQSQTQQQQQQAKDSAMESFSESQQQTNNTSGISSTNTTSSTSSVSQKDSTNSNNPPAAVVVVGTPLASANKQFNSPGPKQVSNNPFTDKQYNSNGSSSSINNTMNSPQNAGFFGLFRPPPQQPQPLFTSSNPAGSGSGNNGSSTKNPSSSSDRDISPSFPPGGHVTTRSRATHHHSESSNRPHKPPKSTQNSYSSSDDFDSDSGGGLVKLPQVCACLYITAACTCF